VSDLTFTLKATLSSHEGVSAYLNKPGDAVVVERGRPRWLILACPCSCGSQIPVNLDSRAGPAWRLYRRRSGVTVYPSIWRDSDCESHFIIAHNRIYLFRADRDGLAQFYDTASEIGVEEQVLARLLPSREQSCLEISDHIPESVPWDVLRACRRLARKGLAIEGGGASLGRFRRAKL
jgi:hypothetical protein